MISRVRSALKGCLFRANLTPRYFSSAVTINGKDYILDGMSNITETILKKVPERLHTVENNPICILRREIEKQLEFRVYEFENPVVSVKQNFDELLFPGDHPGRRRDDTYYVNWEYVFRTHTSAHQLEILKDLRKRNEYSGMVTADVYRSDEIDSKHFPVFHQMELIKLLPGNVTQEDVRKDMMSFLVPVVEHLFPNSIKDSNKTLRWTETTFPFTHPSWELEVLFQNSFLEVLGCGLIREELLANSGWKPFKGWACGFGLERLCMPLFDIPDIRLFWSKNEAFTSQFTSGKINKFKSFSKYPACYKDLSFWIPENFVQNSFMEIVRDIAKDKVEGVKLLDEYQDPDTQKKSRCYRISYRSMDRTLTNAEVDSIHKKISDLSQKVLNVAVR